MMRESSSAYVASREGRWVLESRMRETYLKISLSSQFRADYDGVHHDNLRQMGALDFCL